MSDKESMKYFTSLFLLLLINGTVYSTSQVFVAKITANSSTLTTIRVNLVTSSTITEAGNDEVIVHIFAIEI